MSHDDGIYHRVLLVGKLILTQFAQTNVGLQHHLTTGWHQVATQNFHERGFAAAVRANQAVAFALGEFDGYVFKQGPGPELHGEISGGNHNRLCTEGKKMEARMKARILAELAT